MLNTNAMNSKIRILIKYRQSFALSTDHIGGGLFLESFVMTNAIWRKLS